MSVVAGAVKLTTKPAEAKAEPKDDAKAEPKKNTKKKG